MEIHVVGPLRRVGNVLAVFVTMKQARKAGLSAGQPVHARIEPDATASFGFLKGKMTPRPFDRRKEGLWRDRA